MIGITLDAKFNKSIVGPKKQGKDIERDAVRCHPGGGIIIVLMLSTEVCSCNLLQLEAGNTIKRNGQNLRLTRARYLGTDRSDLQ